MIVRAATEGDIAATAVVATASYAAAFADILGPEILAGYDQAFFAARFAACLARLRVAEFDGAIAGFSLVTEGHLDMLFIAPACQGRGVGQELLSDAEARGTVSLESFRDNHRARRFYEQFGWRLAAEYAREFAGAIGHFVRYEKPYGGKALAFPALRL